VSAQTFALRPRVLEADVLAGRDQRLHEVHPEVSFRELAGRPVATPESTWAGVRERSDLLQTVGIQLPPDLDEAGQAGVDDILDAAVVAWTAHRIALGAAHPLPDPAERDPRGRPMAIWA
jgi:predicted RNase H-like nuclease